MKPPTTNITEFKTEVPLTEKQESFIDWFACGPREEITDHHEKVCKKKPRIPSCFGGSHYDCDCIEYVDYKYKTKIKVNK